MTQDWEAKVIADVLCGRNPAAWLNSCRNARLAGKTLIEYVRDRVDVYREAKKMGVLRIREENPR